MNRSAELEMMDLPGQPRELLAGNLRDLRILNRYLGSYRSVLGGLARLLREQNLRSFTLLDIGTGSADIPAAIAQWARRRNIAARINGLERDVDYSGTGNRSHPEPGRNHHRARRRLGAAVSQRIFRFYSRIAIAASLS